MKRFFSLSFAAVLAVALCCVPALASDVCPHCESSNYDGGECFDCGYDFTYVETCPACEGEFYSSEAMACLDCEYVPGDDGDFDEPDDECMCDVDGHDYVDGFCTCCHEDDPDFVPDDEENVCEDIGHYYDETGICLNCGDYNSEYDESLEGDSDDTSMLSCGCSSVYYSLMVLSPHYIARDDGLFTVRPYCSSCGAFLGSVDYVVLSDLVPYAYYIRSIDGRDNALCDHIADASARLCWPDGTHWFYCVECDAWFHAGLLGAALGYGGYELWVHSNDECVGCAMAFSINANGGNIVIYSPSILDAVTDIFTSFICMVRTVAQTIAAQPLLLFSFAVPLIGVAFVLFRRLT